MLLSWCGNVLVFYVCVLALVFQCQRARQHTGRCALILELAKDLSCPSLPDGTGWEPEVSFGTQPKQKMAPKPSQMRFFRPCAAAAVLGTRSGTSRRMLCLYRRSPRMVARSSRYPRSQQLGLVCVCDQCYNRHFFGHFFLLKPRKVGLRVGSLSYSSS